MYHLLYIIFIIRNDYRTQDSYGRAGSQVPRHSLQPLGLLLLSLEVDKHTLYCKRAGSNVKTKGLEFSLHPYFNSGVLCDFQHVT